MSCEVDVKALGLSKCNKLPKQPKSMFTTPPGFVIPAATIAAGQDAVLAYLQDALLDTEDVRIYKFPNFFKAEDITKDTTYEETSLGKKDVRDPNYAFKFSISESLCMHTALYTHKSYNGRIILLDIENKLIGTLKSNGDFAGLTYSLLNPESLKLSDGTVATVSPLVIEMPNPRQLNQHGALFTLDFVDDLALIIDAVITKVSFISTKVVVTVLAECDSTPISGLVTADFVFKKASDGTTQSITAAEDANNPGTYTLTGTGLVTGPLSLVAVASLSIADVNPVEADAITIV